MGPWEPWIDFLTSPAGTVSALVLIALAAGWLMVGWQTWRRK